MQVDGEIIRYKNPNGEYTVPEWVELVRSNKYDEYSRTFMTNTHKCPPKKLSMNTACELSCFYCSDCHTEGLENALEIIDNENTNKENGDDK